MSTPRISVGLYLRLEAKPGQEAALAAFLKSALPLVEQEPGTITWYALQMTPSTFGIFDTFGDDAGRKAHLAGRVAEALKARGGELLASAPAMQQLEILSAKLP